MSQQGISKAAEVFSLMQQVRHELLALGASDPKTKSGHQDLYLGQMLEVGKEAMKEMFRLATLMDTKDD